MTKEQLTQKQLDIWFSVEAHKNNLFAIGEPYHDEEVFSYLVEGKDHDLLIDTGMGIRSIGSLISQLRIGAKPLLVINTHGHFDHIGGNHDFEQVLLPRNSWEANSVRSGWDNDYMRLNGVVDGFLHGVPTGFDKERYAVRGYSKGKPVLDDDYIIDLGDRKLAVLETPGHTPGSISLFEEATGTLFTSDLLYQGPLYCFEEESSVSSYISTLRELTTISHKINIIHPGHNYSTARVDLIYAALDCFNRIIEGQDPDLVESFRDIQISSFQHPTVERLSVVIRSQYIK